ncbi:MAG: PIN domain-containing protein [Nitrospirae bacterium]|nr:PIN domain-containing protein [Nitrospirota bacterium]
MKVLIDTNIILDVLTKREPFYADSAKIWSFVAEEILDGYISAISVNNLFYIVKKLKDRETAESFVDQILEDFKIISLTKNILKQARTIPKKDFEDLIQYFSAIHEGCDAIVTRNKEDFPSVGIKIMKPTELLKKI